jgi:hypothetical protein
MCVGYILRHKSFDVVTEVTTLYLGLCHLERSIVLSVDVFRIKRGEGDKNMKGIKENKKFDKV